MKTKTILLAVISVVATTLMGVTSAAAKPTVEVIFDHPEKFTDIKDAFIPTDRGQEANLGVIREFLEKRAPKHLEEGQKLTITFTEIDLAGDFEPQHGAAASDIRIIKSIYPPRLDFSYKLVDANGVVIKEGQEKLRDLNFQSRSNPTNINEPLHYETDMLNDWLHDTFRKPRK